MKLEYTIYVVKDSHGNIDHECSVEPSTCISIHGMRDKAGELLRFESDAYHLESWVIENDLEYEEKRLFITV